MFNTTIFSLHLMSMTITSPFYTIGNKYNGEVRSSFINSHFSHFFSNVVLAQTNNHITRVVHTIFAHSLSTPLKFDSNDCYFNSSQMPIKKLTITGKDLNSEGDENHIAFKSDCGNISILFCEFINCSSLNESGGSILITQDCTALIHNTIFAGSHTSSKRGGAICAVKSFKDTEDAYIQDQQISLLNVQYCCFSECYYSGQEIDSLYGVALFSAAKETVLYLSSSVGCSPIDHVRPGGAQFDLQADYVKSKNVNVTGGRAKFCAGIEYRHAKNGNFKFQTLRKIDECMFATSLSEVNMSGLEMLFSNYDNIHLFNNAEDTDTNLFPAFIHVRYLGTNSTGDIEIQNFCFTNFIDETNDKSAKVISRGTYYDSAGIINFAQKIFIKLTNCVCDMTIDPNKIAIEKVDNEVMFTGSIKIDESPINNAFDQLDHGQCEGNVKPGDDVIIEDVREATNIFTFSDVFSQTDDFSYSPRFSQSSDFSKSRDFTNSYYFTQSEKFTKSSEFSETKGFSLSSSFSLSSVFSQSTCFTETEKFSQFGDFNQTSNFTYSHHFTSTNEFTKSLDFTESKSFVQTDGFSHSNVFSKTNDFNATRIFSSTHPFSSSEIFSESKVFTQSSLFTKSNIFSLSQSLIPEKDIIINIKTEEKKKMSTGLKAGIGVGAATAVIAAIALSAFFLMRNRRMTSEIFEDETINIIDDENNSIVTENHLNEIMDNDDPFQEEFE